MSGRVSRILRVRLPAVLSDDDVSSASRDSPVASLNRHFHSLVLGMEPGLAEEATHGYP